MSHSPARRSPAALILTAVAALATVAACASPAASATASAAPSVSAAPSTEPSPSDVASPPASASTEPSAGGGATVATADDATLGTFLVDAEGLTLYLFTVDTAGSGESACYEACAEAWPPLTVAAGSTPTGGAGVTGELGTITRTDGTLQVTYGGAPLYYFANDAAAGDTNGQELNDVWFVVAP